MTKSGLVEIVLIVDRSGSMAPSRVEVLQGLNNFLNDQQNLRGQANFSLLLFNDQRDWRTFRRDLHSVRTYSVEDYQPSGMTALQDAMAMAIHDIGRALAELPEAERPEKVLVATLTDGWENASVDYRGSVGLDRLRALIRQQEEQWHWDFLFLAQNLDAAEAAHQMGIRSNVGVTLAAGRVGTQSAFTTSSQWVSSRRKKS